jgi:hypothetical protein
MASAPAKTVKLLRKGSESDNGWTVAFAECKPSGLNDLRGMGEPTPHSTLGRLLAQVGGTLTPRGWPSLLERFAARVIKTDTCWIWTGTTTNGYGQIAMGSRPQHRFRAHRLSWMLHFGDIPAGLEVMHTCDEPRCVRPAHLRLGTHKENMADAATKGRMRGRHVAPENRVSPARGSVGGGIRRRHAQAHAASSATSARHPQLPPSTVAEGQA